MKIERAKISDLSAILAMIEKEFPYSKQSRAELRRRMRSKNTFFFKATEGGHIMGFAEAELREGLGKVMGLAVAKEYRGIGIGKTIARYAVEFLHSEGAGEVRLLVREENTAAKKIYRDIGFERLRRLDRRIDNAIVEEMSLSLNDAEMNYVA